MRRKLIQARDIVARIDTTILLMITKSPQSESEHLVFHQIGGTHKTFEDFDCAWKRVEARAQKTMNCPNCGNPITYTTPNLEELVNFTCIDIANARRFSDALIDLLNAIS